MATFKCKMCGGALEIQEGATTAECLYCGTRQTLPKLDDDRRRNLYDRANHFRQNGDFDKATAIFEQILGEDNTDAEAYWSLVLCRYGVEYVEDPATHKRVPTVNRTQPTPVASDEDYKSALRYADDYQTSIYEEEAKAIDEIQRGILAVSQKEQPFDVFICYKETDAAGQRTPDSVLAVDLHDQLAREGFKVFCARITLEDKLGTAYEPYIFAALNSAPVMVALGTKAEYFNAPWVRNEWSRYLSLIRGGARKTLIPAYRNMDPYDLPEEFAHLQAQDMSKLGFMQDLTRGIKKIVDAGKTTAASNGVPQTAAPAANSEVEPLLRRAFMFLEDGDFDKANEYCEKVLDKDPENARAYLGKLMAGLKVRNTEELTEFKTPIEDKKLFQQALRFAAGQDKERLNEYAQNNRAKIEQRKAEEAEEAARIEQERMERAYKDIVTFKGSAESVNDIERLIRALEVLGSYKDAPALLTEAKKKLEAARTREAEAARAREAEAARRAKKITFAFIAVILICCAIVYDYRVKKRNEAFATANDYFSSGQYDQAVEWYRKALELGHPEAQTELTQVERALAEKLERITTYSGKYLGNSFTSAQSAAIRNGTFDGMALGDYWTINRMNWRIADFDYLIRSDKAKADPSRHHVMIVPDKILYKHRMNSANTAKGAYSGSEMRASGLNKARNMARGAFGAEHILTYRGHIESAGWVDCSVELMTKEMVFGGDNSLILFRLKPIFRRAGGWYWSQDGSVFFAVADFATVDANGNVSDSHASNAGGVRPVFAIY